MNVLNELSIANTIYSQQYIIDVRNLVVHNFVNKLYSFVFQSFELQVNTTSSV